jgi:hypothetical protein
MTYLTYCLISGTQYIWCKILCKLITQTKDASDFILSSGN